MVRGLRQRIVSWSPSIVLLAVFVADQSLGSTHSVASLVVICPLLASSLVGPRGTVGYGAAALAVWAVLSALDHQYADTGARTASLIRGIGITVGCVIAFAASLVRVRREQRLRRIERVAAAAQHAIVLPVPDAVGQLSLAGRYESSARDATVGGDFFDTAHTPWGTRIVIGDVRGKGLDAVRLAATVLGAFRERAAEHERPAELLQRLSDAVTRRAVSGDFVTALLVQIDDDGLLTAVTAGHPPPVLLRDGAASLLSIPVTRPPLGFAGQARARRFALQPDDVLVLYTDGATEARRAGDRTFFDEQRLLRAIEGARTPDRVVANVFTALAAWTERHLTDDVAVLAVQYVPAGVPAAPPHG